MLGLSDNWCQMPIYLVTDSSVGQFVVLKLRRKKTLAMLLRFFFFLSELMVPTAGVELATY